MVQVIQGRQDASYFHPIFEVNPKRLIEFCVLVFTFNARVLAYSFTIQHFEVQIDKAQNKKGSLRKMLKFITCTLLFWTVIPFVIPLLILLHIYRACVILLQKIVHPNWVGIMNPRDMVVWEEMENPRLQSIMTSVLTLQGQSEFDLDKFQNEFMDKVISYRNLRGEFSYAKFQHYFENWMGFPFWKKEEGFDIKQHIRFLTPEKNQSENESQKVMTEEELLKICGDLMTRPFQPKTSPWEILIVPNYQPKNYQKMDSERNRISAAVFRKSHTILDGFSFNKLFMERFCGESMESLSAPVEPKPRGIFRLGSLQRVLEILLNLGVYHAGFFFLDRDVNIWHDNGKGSKKLTGTVHTVKCDEIPFSVTRTVSKKLGVAPTATMFSCVAGGIRRYFEMEQPEIPEHMTGFFPWPMENHPTDGLVNHWSFVDIILPVGKKDALRRINETNVNFQALKKSPLPQLVWNLSPFFSAIPTPFFNLLGWNRKSTLNLTNFPGVNLHGNRSLHLFGQWKILDSAFFLARLRGNTAAQVSLSTDSGKIHVTISVDRGVVTEQGSKQLAQCITQEFQALHDFTASKQE